MLAHRSSRVASHGGGEAFPDRPTQSLWQSRTIQRAEKVAQVYDVDAGGSAKCRRVGRFIAITRQCQRRVPNTSRTIGSKCESGLVG